MLEHVFPGAPDLSVTALAPPKAPCWGPQSYQAHLVLSTIKHTWPLRAMGSTLRAQVLSQLLVPKFATCVAANLWPSLAGLVRPERPKPRRGKCHLKIT